ncbi:MAG: TlpA family protein disulfide reductase [Proteobacteria bacterium]|nr:TlpA family protein disulfide reductase [Pseudomonadota bacterium]
MSNAPEAPRRNNLRLAGPLLLATILVVASLYAFFPRGNLPGGTIASGGQCKGANARLATLRPLVKGEIAALQVPDVSRPVVPLAFQDGKGEAVTLAHFRGRTILLNLWATWCAPCRHEMPALDTLQEKAGGAGFEVVAVNIDQRNLDKPRAFLEEVRVTRLAYYSDVSARIFQDLKVAGRAFGMPTTLLIDPEGCELAWLAGPAEWAGAEALEFIRAATR